MHILYNEVITAEHASLVFVKTDMTCTQNWGIVHCCPKPVVSRLFRNRNNLCVSEKTLDISIINSENT